MSPVEVASAAARWLAFTALVVVGGAISLEWLAARGEWPATVRHLEPEVHAATSRIARAAGVMLLVATVLRLVAQVRSFLDPGESATAASYLLILARTAWGRGWSLQAATVVLLLGAVLWAGAPRGWWPARALALCAIVVTPLTGHAADGPGGLGVNVALHAAHLLAACCWVGTLLVLLVATSRASRSDPDRQGALLALLVGRFSRLAMASVPLVLTAGLVMTWLYVGSLAALASSPYGRLAVLKALVFGSMALLGAWNWKRLTPSLGEPGGAESMFRVASIEVGLGLVALLVTGILVGLAAPALGQ